MLREAGLRSTGPRVAVLRYLCRSTAPVSHAELFEVLASDGFDRATLYRNLVDLAESGLVLRTDLGDHVWRYELRKEGANGHMVEHPHFVCTDCGGVACLPGVAVTIVSTPEAPRSVRTRKVTVQLTGRCNDCA
jgi:Fur family ferric uptake transcriptional regulator